MQKQQEAVIAIHHGHHLIGHWTKARVALHNADQGRRHSHLNGIGNCGWCGAGEQGHQAQIGVILSSEAGEGFSEPLTWLVDHHDRHHRRGGMGWTLRHGKRQGHRHGHRHDLPTYR